LVIEGLSAAQFEPFAGVADFQKSPNQRRQESVLWFRGNACHSGLRRRLFRNPVPPQNDARKVARHQPGMPNRPGIRGKID
jgi:hypothetical protein